MDSNGAAPPEWDTADRMRKALRTAGLESQEMADYLDVSRGSISNWINGRVAPSRQTLRLWALRTGTPFEWLCHGEAYPHRPVGTQASFHPAPLTTTPSHTAARPSARALCVRASVSTHLSECSRASGSSVNPAMQ